MIVCINCSQETKERMDILLRKEEYKDYSELVAVAVENLLMLHREVGEKGALVIGENPASLVTPQASPRTQTTKEVSSGKSEHGPFRPRKAADAPSAPVTRSPFRIPDLFRSEGLDLLSVNTVETAPDANANDTFTLDRWLFGQYNKLLPAKANCRALLRLASGNENGVPLDMAASEIAESGAQLGDYLADHDRRHLIGRDDALATAFPRSGPDADKSRARYATQFVGMVNSQGVLSGLLWDYRLAALAPGEGARLLPAKAAVTFARMTNSVLDACQTDPAQKFSSEETVFLLEHIRTQVPVEAFAFRTLIQAIRDGADTPDKLDEALRFLVPTDSNRSLSPSFLTSQRSGALSRMADLGLICRERKGVRVSYAIAAEGEAFITRGSNHKTEEKG